jgi:hypothetical protein
MISQTSGRYQPDLPAGWLWAQQQVGAGVRCDEEINAHRVSPEAASCHPAGEAPGVEAVLGEKRIGGFAAGIVA